MTGGSWCINAPASSSSGGVAQRQVSYTGSQLPQQDEAPSPHGDAGSITHPLLAAFLPGLILCPLLASLAPAE